MQHRHLLVQGGIGAALPGIPANAAPPFDKDTVQKFRQTASGIAAHYKIHIGVAHFQLFADLLLLGHAAGQGNNKVGLLLFEALKRPHIAKDTLLGIFPHGTCIIQDEIRLTDLICKAIAQLGQHPLKAFTIVNALLAAKGMHMGQRRGLVLFAEVFFYGIGPPLLLAERPVILYGFFGLAQRTATLSFYNFPPYIVS